MSTVYEPRPRYVVEVANSISNIVGHRMVGAWNFSYAYLHLSDAQAMAERLAEENEYVRVIDRAEPAKTAGQMIE